MTRKSILSALLAGALCVGMLAGCGSGSSEVSSAGTASSASEAAEKAQAVSEAPAPAETAAPVQADASSAEASVVEDAGGIPDNTEANANLDFTAHKELLSTLHTQLPVTDEETTLTYFMGFESDSLNYIDGGDLNNHQVFQWLRENTGVNLELTVVERTNLTDKFNLMIASGDYTDIMNMNSYAAGVEAAYDDDIIMDLSDIIEENMPNYWTIIQSDKNVLKKVQDGDMFLVVYPIKDSIVNPADAGTFIRMDWLEDLGLDVPKTYDQLTEVLTAFKTEKGASEPMALQQSISLPDGLLMGGFGAKAELASAGGSGNALSAYYQVDGEVVYGATADGTRKFLSWLHELNEQGLINLENIQNRDQNPFGELNATAAADGSVGYIFQNQPFGGNYTTMAKEQYGDENCNWWPVQDVAETEDQEIPFYEQDSLVDSITSTLSISTQCDEPEIALKFLDYGYSYEGSLLYNFGFQTGSGHEVESWDYDADGVPQFDADVVHSIGATNLVSSILTTKDLGGVVFDGRLDFEFDERERSCFDAWKTNKNTSQMISSDVTLTSEESTEAAQIYSDILTYVSTTTLQFIGGDLDIDDDAAWESYCADIEDMNLQGLTDIVQGAYDREMN